MRAFEIEQQGSYVARIFNPRSYFQVTQDIIKRRAYPLVIDKKSVDQNSRYQFKMVNTYIEKTSSVSISSTVSNDSVVGSKTEIDSNCNIV